MADANRCERCRKKFRYPYLLRRHRSRKTPCAAAEASPETAELEELCHRAIYAQKEQIDDLVQLVKLLIAALEKKSGVIADFQSELGGDKVSPCF